MKSIRIIPNHNYLWIVKSPDEEADELTLLFCKWNNVEYLLDLFMEIFEVLRSFFRIKRFEQAVEDTFEDIEAIEELMLEFPCIENIDDFLKKLDITATRVYELVREKARKWDNRIMQERKHTEFELDLLNRCNAYFNVNGVFDQGSFVELVKEE